MNEDIELWEFKYEEYTRTFEEKKDGPIRNFVAAPCI